MVGCAKDGRKAVIRPDKGMLITKGKSRMRDSKLVAERSPVAKRVMITAYCICAVFIMVVGCVVTLRCISLGCISADEGTRDVVDCVTTSQGEAVCPSNSFNLPADSVSRMELAALHDGDRSAAARLAGYYSIYRNKGSLGDVWHYRAAQLGDVTSLYNLCVRESCCWQKRIFSPDVVNNSDFLELSKIAQDYVRFHVRHCHGIDDGTEYVGDACAKIRNLDADLAIAKVGLMDAIYDMEGHRSAWPVVYFAYKTRQKSGYVSHDKAVDGVMVFSDFLGEDCQKAIDIAESGEMGWLVVSVEYDDRFGFRPKELKPRELCMCVYKVLEQVFTDFSLAPNVKVSFAGNAMFVEQMTANSSGKFVVSPAPDIFACKLRRYLQPK